MLELLKKLGLPSAVAAIVATIVTIVPFIFKIDERYAKEEYVKEQVAQLEKENQRLQKELAEMVGTVNTMTVFIMQGRVPVRQPGQPTLMMAPRPTFESSGPDANVPPAQPETMPQNWGEIKNRLEEQKGRLKD